MSALAIVGDVERFGSGLVPLIHAVNSTLADLAEWRPVLQPGWRAVPHHTLSKRASLPHWIPVTVSPLFWSHSRSHFMPGSTQYDAIKSLFPVDLFPAGMPRQRRSDKFHRFNNHEQLRAFGMAAIVRAELLTMVTIRLHPGETVEHVIKSWNQYRERHGFRPLSYFGVTVFAPHRHAHLLMPIAGKDTAEIEADYEFVCRRSGASKPQIWGHDLDKENPSAKINFTRVRWDGVRYRGLPGALRYLDENIAEGEGDAGLIPLLHASKDLKQLALGIARGEDMTGRQGDVTDLSPPLPSYDERLMSLFRAPGNRDNVSAAIDAEMKHRRLFEDGWRQPTRNEAQQKVLGDWLRLCVPSDLKAA